MCVCSLKEEVDERRGRKKRYLAGADSFAGTTSYCKVHDLKTQRQGSSVLKPFYLTKHLRSGTQCQYLDDGKELTNNLVGGDPSNSITGSWKGPVWQDTAHKFWKQYQLLV